MDWGFIVCTGLFVVLVAWGMLADLATMTIPDTVSIGLVAGFLLCAVWAGAPLVTIGMHLGVGVIVFGIAAVFFFLNAFGGGDVKMLAAVAVWAGWPMVITLGVWVALLGGVLALAMLVFRRIPLPAAAGDLAWLARLHRRDGGIPYGVAIGIGALLLLPRITWWQN